MSKQILSYKVFSSSKEFEKWQEDNNVTILAVNPISGGFNLTTTTGTELQESSAALDLCIFVLYCKAQQAN